jgi:hypothetical protein
LSNILYCLSYFQAGNLRFEAYNQEDECSVPVAVFEPPDPTKRPMYCKGKVMLFEGNDLHITVHIQRTKVCCSFEVLSSLSDTLG